MKKTLTFFLCLLLFIGLLSVVPPLKTDAATFTVDFPTRCVALYLENLDTNTVVYEKNPTSRRYPASTTKIMTYIVTMEHVSNPRETYTTVKGSVLDQLYATGSSIADLQEGEKLSIYQLLCAMMIPSGNDAAMVLADYIGGGNISKFVDMMNQKAAELGCAGTHFVNPHGLNDPEHYTTAVDLAKITKYALTLPDFADITNTVTSYVLGEDRFPLVTTNSMIDENRGGDYYYPYASGIKTGSTGNDSGYCLVSTAAKNGYTYLCVALGAPYEDPEGEQYENGAMRDSVELYEWAFEELSIKKILDKNELTREIELKYAWNKDSIHLSPAENFSTVIPDDVNIESIDRVYSIPDSIDAPVREGQKIGTVTLSYANQELATIDLLANESVDSSELLIAVERMKTIVSSTWFIVFVSVIGAAIVIYIVSAVLYNRRRRSVRTVKKYRKF